MINYPLSSNGRLARTPLLRLSGGMSQYESSNNLRKTAAQADQLSEISLLLPHLVKICRNSSELRISHHTTQMSVHRLKNAGDIYWLNVSSS
jgi:hypothetical protein